MVMRLSIISGTPENGRHVGAIVCCVCCTVCINTAARGSLRAAAFHALATVAYLADKAYLLCCHVSTVPTNCHTNVVHVIAFEKNSSDFVLRHSKVNSLFIYLFFSRLLYCTLSYILYSTELSETTSSPPVGVRRCSFFEASLRLMRCKGANENPNKTKPRVIRAGVRRERKKGRDEKPSLGQQQQKKPSRRPAADASSLEGTAVIRSSQALLR